MSIPDILRRRQLNGRANRGLSSTEQFVKKLDVAHELKGHTGCVNALDWSQDGRYLASGSDDTRIIIWDAYASGLEQAKQIRTGHTRNIFSVKFVPNSGNRTLISAAGDKQIRVFDVEYGASSATVLHEPCERVVHRAHHDRVKRIAVEDDGHCFLSCAEDGDIRQFDLRENNASDYRPPLISYAKYQIDLNAMSLNKSNPYLLALGGSHPCAFLHDRRMVGRDLRAEWGNISTSRSHTQCVKKFKSPKGKTSFRGEHLTALHFSKANPRELICSWLCDNVYLFDIHGETEQQRSTTFQGSTSVRSNLPENATHKRKRSPPAEHDLLLPDGIDLFDLLHQTRTWLLNPPFEIDDYQASYENFLEAAAVISDRASSSDYSSLVQHIESCDLMLQALTLAIPDDMEAIEPRDQSEDLWEYVALNLIVRATCIESTDPSQFRALDYSLSDLQKPVIDVTARQEPGKHIFKSREALIICFNTLIATKEGLESLKTDTAHTFWITRVCRALLAATQPHVDRLKRPEIMPDCSDDSDSDSHVEEETVSSTDEMQDIDEDDESDQEYQDALEDAIHSVQPGVPVGLPIRSFSGHVNVETIKDVNFLGMEDEYVMSGSDDGLLFIWDKKTGRIVTMLQGDSSVTNVMEANPSCTALAVSGIDDTVKIFQPFEDVGMARVLASRRITETEYQIRARNEVRSGGEDVGFHNFAMPRNLMLDLAGRLDQGGECRQQ